MSQPAREWAVVTGASSGIGAAAAARLAGTGFDLVLGARRTDRVRALADGLAASHGVRVLPEPLDVTDPASMAAFAAAAPGCDVLVCNAGGALGLDPVVDFDEGDWESMWQTNVLGVARTVAAFHEKLVASGDGRVAVITSVAGHQIYAGGGGYAAVKHAAAALCDTLRLELIGEPVRIIEIAPGLVQTEFSQVRFKGDRERADAVYAGITPLSADDVADAIAWAVTRPAHMTVARIDLYPRGQASARDVHRRPQPG